MLDAFAHAELDVVRVEVVAARACELLGVLLLHAHLLRKMDRCLHLLRPAPRYLFFVEVNILVLHVRAGARLSQVTDTMIEEC